MFSLKLNTADMDRAITQLGNRATPAIARALNRAAVSTRTVMVRLVSQDTGLKVGAVRDQTSITKATAKAGRLAAQIIISGKPVPLIDFNARWNRRRGVTARLRGGKGTYPHAFIATMPGGHRGVFQRVPGALRRGPAPQRAGLPIYELHGPTLASVFRKHIGVGLARGAEAIQTNLAHEYVRSGWRDVGSGVQVLE